MLKVFKRMPFDILNDGTHFLMENYFHSLGRGGNFWEYLNKNACRKQAGGGKRNQSSVDNRKIFSYFQLPKQHVLSPKTPLRHQISYNNHIACFTIRKKSKNKNPYIINYISQQNLDIQFIIVHKKIYGKDRKWKETTWM